MSLSWTEYTADNPQFYQKKETPSLNVFLNISDPMSPKFSETYIASWPYFSLQLKVSPALIEGFDIGQ